MALTQANLDALDQAIATGTLEVQLGERRVRYRSMDELLAARAHVSQQLAAASASGRKGATRRFHFTTARGD